MSMKQRDREKFLARQAEEKRARQASSPARKRRRTPRERIASPEEQHARYIDSGPLAWDDRDNPDY
jgi:hypothetical protein